MPRKRRPSQPATPVGDVYGEGVASREAQKVIPLPNNRNVDANTTSQSAPSPGAAVAPPQGPPDLGAVLQAAQSAPAPSGGLFAPTGRPAEPVTAGLPIGAGAGPEAVNAGGDPVLDQLRAIYLQYPNDDLRALIQDRVNGE